MDTSKESPTTTTREPRVYLVGLPVMVVVHDDGTVVYEVDTSEAGASLFETEHIETEYDEDTIAADAARVEADHHRRWATQNEGDQS
jgi:hypothetical protein